MIQASYSAGTNRSWPGPNSGGRYSVAKQSCSTPKREGSRLSARRGSSDCLHSLGETARMAQEIRKKSYRLKGRNCILSRRRDHFLTGAKQSGVCFSFTTTSTLSLSTFPSGDYHPQTQASWKFSHGAIGHVLERWRIKCPTVA